MLSARALLALALLAAAAVLAFLAVRSASINPCAPHDDFGWWFVVGVGVLTVAAVFQVLPPKALDRRGVLAALLAAVLGAAASFALFLLLLFIWVGHCTA
jgi:beta-lactamase regulating signal transducer with metallopeptidase domain